MYNSSTEEVTSLSRPVSGRKPPQSGLTRLLGDSETLRKNLDGSFRHVEEDEDDPSTDVPMSPAARIAATPGTPRMQQVLKFGTDEDAGEATKYGFYILWAIDVSG
jgi:hypothetical protein